MRQRGCLALVTEEPDERIAHVRICGGAGCVNRQPYPEVRACSHGRQPMVGGIDKIQPRTRRQQASLSVAPLQGCVIRERGPRATPSIGQIKTVIANSGKVGEFVAGDVWGRLVELGENLVAEIVAVALAELRKVDPCTWQR